MSLKYLRMTSSLQHDLNGNFIRKERCHLVILSKIRILGAKLKSIWNYPCMYLNYVELILVLEKFKVIQKI